MLKSIDLEEYSDILNEIEYIEVCEVMDSLDLGEDDARGVLLANSLESQAREFHTHLALCV